MNAVERACGAVVVVSAGFSETGAQGRALEDQVVRTAESYGMALVGPNCMGVISSHQRLYATGFTLLRPDPGGASMVSQSGNLGTQLLVAAERRKGGVGKFVGVGNEAMIDAVDFINYFRTDPAARPPSSPTWRASTTVADCWTWSARPRRRSRSWCCAGA